ncbi:hypothetical protein HTY54_27870 [Escherichia coli]|nr:hypothetical protein [Escherichia coli]
MFFKKSGFISGSGNTHLFVLSVIRLAGNENAGTEGGKHRKASDADMKKSRSGTCLIHAVEIAAIDFHGFTNLCHKEFHL